MAVKPITNPNPIAPEKINRGHEVSRRNETIRNSNESKSYIPGVDYTKDYQIVLKDLDTSIMSHIKNVMKPKIIQNGSYVDVPLLYGNQERWANMQTNGVIRDKNNSLMLPLMMFKRSSVEFNDEFPSYKHDVTGQFVSVVRTSKWSKDNQYTQFAVQKGAKPVEENIVTTIPQYVNTNYEFVVQTHFMEQMNTIIEQFVQQHNTYWGDNTSYRFLTAVDGTMTDSTEMEIAGERVIKSSFNVQLKGYLIPQTVSNIVQNKRFTTKKTITPSRITFSEKTE